MRCYLLLGAVLLSTAPAHGQLDKLPVGAIPGAAFSKSLSQSSLYFVKNQGQVDDRVHYYVHGRDRDVFVTEEGLTLLLQPPPTAQSGAAFAVRLEFVDAQPHPKPQAEGSKGPLVNLFTGGQGSWRTSIPTTSGLVYKDLWPGIDLALVGDTQRINYEFRVKPGADPDQIRMRYRGGAPPRLESSGDLAVDTPLGTLRDQRPFSYQESGGQRIEVGSGYALAASKDGTFGFTLSKYDRTRLLVIDPAVFVYASYLGGAGEDWGSAIAVDASGAAYITGPTSSVETTFPTETGFGALPGADRTYNGGGYDAFVAKVLPSGAGLEYVTYIGGSGRDVPADIAVDSAGSAYVAGYTASGTGFPVLGGPTTSYHGGSNDIFVVKLNPTGTALLYSGFIGGADDDREPGIAIDTYGSAYITGLTYSSESTFPTGTGFGSLPGADQTHNGDGDGFVVKVSPDGSSLQFASYIGGSAFDQGYGIGIDAARNVYVGGNVGSDENTFPDGDGVGPIPGPDTTYNGGAFDAFVVKLNAEGTSFAYVAFVGGAGGSDRDERYATGLAVDPQGSAWIAGGRASAEDTFPTGQGFGSIPGFDRTSNGGRDAFVVKINSAGTAFDYATYIGGSGLDGANAIAVDGDGNAYVAGDTSSTGLTFPDGGGFGSVSGPDTTYNGGGNDAFVVKLNAAGTGLWYATYIGGPGDDLGHSIAVDGAGNAYLTGLIISPSGFPGGNGFGGLPGFDQTYNGGSQDAFVVKIGPPSPTPTAGAGPDQSVQVGTTVALQGSGSCPNGSPVPTWSFIGKPPGSAATLSDLNAWRPTFVADAAGYYTLGLQASCNSGAGFDYVAIRARGCGDGLTIYPVSVTRPPGSLYHFVANGGTGNYTWSIAEAGSGTPSIVTTADGGADYTAGDESGEDSILLADTCGTQTATVYVQTDTRPEAVVVLDPPITQGLGTVMVTATFSTPVQDALACADQVQCFSMDLVAESGGRVWTHALSVAPSPNGLTSGRHAIAATGKSPSGIWGPFGRAEELNVTRSRASVLLLNGYNFDDCGEHPTQWWGLSAPHDPIPCQLAKDFLGATACTQETNNCSSADSPDRVCVVTGVDGRADIKKASDQLGLFISSRSWLTDAGPPVLVGHSYGGQIGRYYASHHPGSVLAVVTIDTPHAGTPLARLQELAESVAGYWNGGLCTEQCCDKALQYLGSDGASKLFEELTLYERAAPTPIHALASEVTVHPNLAFTAGGLFDATVMTWNQGDNIVPLSSQLGRGLGNCLQKAGSTLECPDLVATLASYFHSSQTPYRELSTRTPPSNLHNEILGTPSSWRGFYCGELVPALNEALGTNKSPSLCSSQVVHQQLMAGEEAAGLRTTLDPPVRSVLEVSGTLTTMDPEQMFEFPVEAGSDLVVFVSSQNSNPILTLTDPPGNSYRAETADGLTNAYLATMSGDALQQFFRIRKPQPGLWRAVLTSANGVSGPNLPSTGSRWSAGVSIRSPLQLTVEVSDLYSAVGEDLVLRGRMATQGSDVSTVAIRGILTAVSTGSLTDFVFFDDGTHDDGAPGDGVYGARLPLDSADEFQWQIIAEGDSSIGPFRRFENGTILVGILESTVGGDFVESAPDVDEDGHFDSLDWSFTIVVPRAGEYTVFGDLEDAHGTLVTRGVSEIEATGEGPVPVTLRFQGKLIYSSRLLGPYRLRNLKIAASAHDGRRLSGRSEGDVWSGGPHWSWLNFEREESPSLAWLFPVVQEVTASNDVNLRWLVHDGNGATTLDLFYDTIGEGFGGTVIAADLDAVNGLMSYDWNVSALPDGVYYVYARIRNGDYSNAVYGGSIGRLIDTDGDGAPDSWEAPHGLNPNDSSDAFEDSDGDSLANLDEYLSSTHPQMADTDAGGERDYSELVNGRDAATSGDDVVGISLLSVTPAVGDSRGGDTVFVIGSGFQNGATVDFGGTVAAGVTFINSTRLLVVTPAHAVATVDFTVTNPSGGGSVTKAEGFRFLCEFVEPPVASNSGPFCPGQPLHLNASGPGEATYQWAGPNGFTSSLQNPMIDPATAAAAGQYAVTMTVGSCQVQATTVAVSSAPAAPSVSSNGPLCSGQDLHLSATAVEGATFSWTGPNGFVSALEDPVLSAANPAASGIYSVTATVNSCPSAPAHTEVVVRALPTAVVSGSAQICLGESTAIQAALTGTAPWALTWSDGVSQSGLGASPAIRTVQPTINTTFEVTTVSDAYCAGTESGGAAITVDDQCGSQLHTVTPCRIADTRDPTGPYGAPSLVSGETRLFTIAGRCGIPGTAKAVVLNVTVTGATAPGFLTLFSADTPLPLASTINFGVGKTRANNAIGRLGAGGTLAVFSGQSSAGVVDVILDVSGYFE